MRIKNKSKIKTYDGFLLVELIVALFIFSIVSLVSLGSVITIFDSNKKAQSLQSVMNNLNLAMDSMTKSLAVGRDYNMSGQNITFTSQDGESVTFAFLSSGCPSNTGSNSTSGCLTRKIGSGSTLRLTASEIDVQDVNFDITGTGSGDNIQPRVSIFIKGVAKAGPRNDTEFTLQTAVSQRSPDF